VLGERGRIARGPPTCDVREGELEQPPVVVAGGRRQHERREGARRNAPDTGSRRAEDEPPHAVRRAARKLLREAAAERVAEHVGALEPELVHQRADDLGESLHPQGSTRPLRQPGAGRVEGDQLAVGDTAGERRPHVEVRPDPGDQQQRAPGTLSSDAQAQPPGPDEEGVVHRRKLRLDGRQANVPDGRTCGSRL
jgi:hypothetical protein